MLKFWLYVLVLVVLCVLGLTIGSANETMVEFDFLFVQTKLSLGMVMVVGMVVGIVIGIYLSLFFILKMWGKAINAKSEVRKLERVVEEQSRAAKA